MNASSKRFFPVIHCVCPYKEQGIGHAIKNTRIAIENGADGVFLIGHSINCHKLSYIYQQVREQFPEIWIGVNFLGLTAAADWSSLPIMVNVCLGINALWMDCVPDERFMFGKLGTHKPVEVFGGVAFKYIDPNIRGAALSRECARAKQLVDVITTSGSKTGSPPEVAKLEEIRRNIGTETRLALASGVTRENVPLFLSTATDFLVASSIIEPRKERGGHEYLVPEKVRSLADEIHK